MRSISDTGGLDGKDPHQKSSFVPQYYVMYDIDSDSDRVWTCLALESISKYLPRGDGSLMCMVLSYLSSYEKLSDESLSCLNTLLHTLNSEQSAQVTDLLAARLVSAEEGEKLNLYYPLYPQFSSMLLCPIKNRTHILLLHIPPKIIVK